MWKIGILIIFLMGCSASRHIDGDIKFIRAENSGAESKVIQVDTNGDGKVDSEIVFYTQQDSLYTDVVAYFWLPWKCKPECQTAALKSLAYHVAFDIPVKDGIYDYAFIDLNCNGTLDTVICYTFGCEEAMILFGQD